MTIGELRKALEGIPDDMPVGAPDEDGISCEIQWAGETCHADTGRPYFLINPNGGNEVIE